LAELSHAATASFLHLLIDEVSAEPANGLPFLSMALDWQVSAARAVAAESSKLLSAKFFSSSFPFSY
jgi:hypothetical protein